MPDKTYHSMNRAKRLKEINQLLKKVNQVVDNHTGEANILNDLAELFIPEMADWCCIHLLRSEGVFERVAFSPSEKLKSQAVYDWVENILPNDEAAGLPAVIQSGRSQLELLDNPTQLGTGAGISSYMIVPLIIQGRILGTISLVCAESGRNYDQKLLEVGENIVLHISGQMKLELLQPSGQRLRSEEEQREGEETIELHETMAQLKQTEDMVQTLFRVSNKLNATLDVELILDTLAQEAIQIVNGESGFAGLRTADGMTVHKYFQDGMAIPFEHTWAPGEGIPGWVLKYKVPYGTSDAENDPYLNRSLAINANVRSIICTPIHDTTGEVIGFFNIRNKKGEEGFSINDQEMLLTLAPVASIAIQNALAYQQRMTTVNELRESSKRLQDLAASLEKAREEERLRISHELHDELGQALTAMKFDLAQLTGQLELQDQDMALKTREITVQLNSLIQTVRRIATELRPGMLDDLGLAASVEWQARDFEKRTGIACKLSLPDKEISPTQDQSLAIFRIFQEALTNVVQYAGAGHVDVRLDQTGDWLTLEMHDDGQGIKDEEILNPRSLGLLGMRERANYLGGTFEIKGAPGRGTFVKVSIPIVREP